jgi:hypothetical protein
MMDKFLIKDKLETCSNDAIKNVENQYYEIMSNLRRKLTEQLFDIVSRNLRAPATFMPDFITLNIFDKFKKEYEFVMKEAARAYNNALNTADNIIEKDDSEEGLYHAFSVYTDIAEDTEVLNVSRLISNIIDEYISSLKYKLSSIFNYMQNSRQVDEDINAILGESSRLLNKVFDETLDIISGIKNDNNKAIDELIDELVSMLRVSNKEEYIHGFGEDTFRYDGHEVTYRFEGNNLTLYMDNIKVNDSYTLADINRTIQDKFPQAKEVTDSMVRRISEIEMDKKEESPSEAMFRSVPSKPELKADVELIDTSRIKELTPILDITDDEPKRKEHDDRLDRIRELTPMLDITDDEPKVKKESPKLDTEELMSKLEIKDDEPETKQESSKLDIDELLSKLEIKDDEDQYVNPNASTNPEDIKLTPEEINALLHGLDIPEEEQQLIQQEEVKDEDFGALQLRMDQLMRIPEVQTFVELEDNPYVKEWQDIQSKMEYYNAKKDYEALVESQQEQKTTIKMI